MNSKRVGLIIVVCLILPFLLVGGCTTPNSFDSKLNKIIRPYRFSIAGWEIKALSYELEDWIFGDSETADESPVVLEYFATTRYIGDLERQIAAVKDGIEPGDLTVLQAQLEVFQVQKDALENRAEGIMEQQIRETLAQLGIYNPMDSYLGLDITFPPVNFELETPPHLLVVSPRDRIDRMKEITLLQDMTPEDIENIEAEIDELGVSSLVVGLGGMATYPSFVVDDAGLQFTINAAIEEWLHQYLFFKPLGFLYALDLAGISKNYEIAIMNETLAGMTSREIGSILYQDYYSQYLEGDSQLEAAETGFDFNQEMRDIRLAVDNYLAKGEIEQAEVFMEQKRLFLASKGYYIRRLNQAYFAFYGTYADRPTSIDPIGAELRELREQMVSLSEFLNAVAVMTSRDALVSSIE